MDESGTDAKETCVMKIGIITFQRTNNYGAVLQCYALQETLKKLDYDVRVVDYYQPFIEKDNAIVNWIALKKNLRGLRSFIRFVVYNIRYRLRILYNFASFRKKYLRLTSKCSETNVPADFDAYVIGSDQLWTIEHTGGKLDPVYTASFENGQKRIYAYAISVNERTINAMDSVVLNKIVGKFRGISFREKKSANLIGEKTKRKCRCDIDPTLLAPVDCWDSLLNKRWRQKEYIALYQVRSYLNSAEIVKQKTSNLARTLGVEIVDLSVYKYSPADFVSIIKYSKCVVTSSFHGTAFSLIFGKPLWVFKLCDGHDERCVSLLQTVGAANCVVGLDDNLDLIPSMNYEVISSNIAALRDNSLSYLRQIKDEYSFL